VSGLGESKSNLVGGEFVVAVGDGINLVLHDFSVEWVEEDLLVLLSVKGDSDGFSGDVGGEDLWRSYIRIN